MPDSPLSPDTVLLAQSRASEGRLREAAQLLSGQPESVETPSLWLCLASLYREAGDVAAARDALEQAYGMTGRDALLVRRALTVPSMMQSTEAIAADRARVHRELGELLERPLSIGDPAAELPSLDFYFAYHGLDDAGLRRQLAEVMRNACPELRYTAPHCLRTRRRRVLRVGFASEYLRDHTIGRLNRGLITGLSAERFETVAIFLGGVADEFGAELAAQVHAHIEPPTDLWQARRQIADAELDVLYYTDVGLGSFSYFLAHARLAPLQLATWGHPVTTGLDTVDGFVSTAVEAEGAEAHYAEPLIRLSDPAVCYERPTAPPEQSRADLGLPSGARLYLCPQSSFKLHPDFDAVLVEILRRDPSGVVVLLEPKYDVWKDLLLERLRALMPDVEQQLCFVPPLPRTSYLALLANGDVMLDPLHFGGGHTTLEALAMRTPVVTCPSRFLRGRLTLSWYRALGLSEGIAESPSHYAETAVALATDRSRLAAARRAIGERHGSLFAVQRAVTEHERLFAGS